MLGVTRKNLLPLALLVLSVTACEKQVTAQFSPSEGTHDVPVNAAIRARYVGKHWIREAEAHEENFRLAHCGSSSTGSSAASPSSTTGTEKTAEATESSDRTATEKSSKGTTVNGRLVYRKFDVIRTHESGEKEMLKRTDIIFVPFVDSVRKTPLDPETSYCFTASDVKDEGNNLALGGTLSFQTEEDPEFFFRTEKVNAWLRTPDDETHGSATINPDDIMVLEFEGPVLPKEVETGTNICSTGLSGNVSSTGDANRACAQSGPAISTNVTLVEAFEENEDGIIPVHYTYYGISGLFQTGTSYVVEPGLHKPGMNVRPATQMEIAVSGDRGESVDEAKQQAFLRSVMPEATDKSAFSLVPVNRQEDRR